MQIDDPNLLLDDAARVHAGVLDESAAAIGVRPPCQALEGGAADAPEGMRGLPPFPREMSIVAPVIGLLVCQRRTSAIGRDKRTL